MSGVTLGEINVVCTDLEAALGFYRDALGLSEAGHEDGAVRLDFGRVSLLLLPAAERRRATSGYPAQATISFDVITDDADDTVARLEAAGGTRLGAIDDGAGWAVADPDGNVIEVIGSKGDQPR